MSFYKLFNGQITSIPRSEIEDTHVAILVPMLTPGSIDFRVPIRAYVVLDSEGLALAISQMSSDSMVTEASTAGRCSCCRTQGWGDTPVVHPCSHHRFASQECMCRI